MVVTRMWCPSGAGSSELKLAGLPKGVTVRVAESTKASCESAK